MTNELIDDIYSTFSRYKLNERITGCYCSVCLTEDFNRRIHSVLLRDIQPGLFSFYISAVGITEGDCNDFKYFLPRILELIYQNIELNQTDTFYLFIWNVLQGIDYSNWAPKEMDLLIRFFKLYWDQIKDKDDPEIDDLTISSVKSTVFESLAV